MFLTGFLKISCMDTLSPLVSHGPGARKTCCPLAKVGAALHPGRPWTVVAVTDLSISPQTLLSQWSHPVCAKETFGGLRPYLSMAEGTGELCIEGSGWCPPGSTLRMCLGLCLCLRGRGTAGCSQRFQSSRKTTRHAGERLCLEQGSACGLL